MKECYGSRSGEVEDEDLGGLNARQPQALLRGDARAVAGRERVPVQPRRKEKVWNVSSQP